MLLAAGVDASALPRRRVPVPTATLVTRWDLDPYARGAYSALAPGVPPSTRRVLANALIGGRVVLAGEYASSSHPATTTGAYASGQRAAQVILERVRPSRVIVVGAGMAGAAAARALQDAGIEVIVLEARNRIGGRIHSDESWGVPVELGAAWVHGVQGNPIASLARESALRLLPTDFDDAITRDTVTGRSSPQAEAAQAQVVNLAGRLESAWPPVSTSAGSWMRQRGWREDRFGSWAAEVEIAQEFGLQPNALGVRALEEGDDLRGGDAMVGGGYARIPQSLLSGIEVRLATPVRSVTTGSSAVSVRLAGGELLSTDAVVVAVPVSLLRSGAVTIDPMPRPVQRAIASLVTGDLEKVVLRYDEQWWPRTSIIGVVGGGAPGAPAGSAAALRWTEFYSLTELLGFPALVGFSGGAASLARPRTDAECVAEATAALGAAFGHA